MNLTYRTCSPSCSKHGWLALTSDNFHRKVWALNDMLWVTGPNGLQKPFKAGHILLKLAKGKKFFFLGRIANAEINVMSLYLTLKYLQVMFRVNGYLCNEKENGILIKSMFPDIAGLCPLCNIWNYRAFILMRNVLNRRIYRAQCTLQ